MCRFGTSLQYHTLEWCIVCNSLMCVAELGAWLPCLVYKDDHYICAPLAFAHWPSGGVGLILYSTNQVVYIIASEPPSLCMWLNWLLCFTQSYICATGPWEQIAQAKAPTKSTERKYVHVHQTDYVQVVLTNNLQYIYGYIYIYNVVRPLYLD